MRSNNLKTVTQRIKELKGQDFTEDFMVQNGVLKVRSSNKTFKPDEVTIINKFRFEGDSNPDDLSILYALETNSGLKGLLVNGYGISADPDIDEFLMAAEGR